MQSEDIPGESGDLCSSLIGINFAIIQHVLVHTTLITINILTKCTLQYVNNDIAH